MLSADSMLERSWACGLEFMYNQRQLSRFDLLPMLRNACISLVLEMPKTMVAEWYMI